MSLWMFNNSLLFNSHYGAKQGQDAVGQGR